MTKNPNITVGKFLSQALRALSQEAHDTDGDRTKTKSDCLARYVWDAALGHTLVTLDRNTGERKEKVIPPQTWAINLIFDRIEGKVMPSEESINGKPMLAERVEKLNQEQFNV